MKENKKSSNPLLSCLFWVIFGVPLKIGSTLYQEAGKLIGNGSKTTRFMRFLVLIPSVLSTLFLLQRLFIWAESHIPETHSFLKTIINLLCSWLYFGIFMGITVIPALHLIKGCFSKIFESPKHLFSTVLFISDKISNLGLSKPIGSLIPIGQDLDKKKKVCLSESERNMHCHVLGSTGSGKTESIILPMIEHDIRQGHGVLFIDGKGDLENLIKIVGMAEKQGRYNDFRFFSLSHPELSHNYNPLIHGNPTEIKDKIISSFIWTEEYYKKASESVLLTIIRAAKSSGQSISFSQLHAWLSDLKELTLLKNKCIDLEIKADLNQLISDYSQTKKSIQGLIADIGLISKSEFKDSLETNNPEIDLQKAYDENQIVYIQLNTQGYEETARRLGRIILQDLKTVSNEVQSHRLQSQRRFFPVFIDEFSSFASESFIELLNKARGAGFAITIAHQSLGDLLKQGEAFQTQIMENTNIKIIMRQDDPAGSETLSKAIGTVTCSNETQQIEDHILWGKQLTGIGSIRQVQEFLIHPDKIKRLQRGEAVLLVKQPFKTAIIKAYRFETTRNLSKGLDLLKSMRNERKITLPQKKVFEGNPLDEFKEISRIASKTLTNIN